MMAAVMQYALEEGHWDHTLLCLRGIGHEDLLEDPAQAA